MEFNITQEEVNEEIRRIKEEERFKSITYTILNEVKESFEASMKELKLQTEILLKSKDEEIRFMNEKFNSLKVISESQDELINQNNKEIRDLKTKLVNTESQIIGCSSHVNSVDRIIDSIRKDYLGLSNQLMDKQEDLDMIKISIKRYLKSLYYEKAITLGSSSHMGCNNYWVTSNFIGIYSEYRDEYPEIKSSLSKYILQKVYKYISGISLLYMSGPSSGSALPNSKDIFICTLFDRVISKYEYFGKFVLPILSKYSGSIPKSLDSRVFVLKKEHGDLAPQIAKELLMSLP
jgi:hypothetical protein